jgi:predicted dehydrogenase
MSRLRFGVIGCGFWSQYQIAGWREVGGVELVAVYNRTRSKAEAIAARFGVPRVYDDAEAMLDREELDFVDIITDVDSHERFVGLAVQHRLPVICQKPLAPSLEAAGRMVAGSRQAGVPLLVHENWRWQRPIRELRRVLSSGALGRPHRARVTYANSFPVFDNQPALRELEQFILTDMGTHILDVARFLFGEAHSLYCHTRRVDASIRGEDVATVLMVMGDDVTVTCELSYASPVEHDRFPETYILVECERGAVELGPDYWLRSTTKGEGTLSRRYPPPQYDWADPRYALVHASIVPCTRDLLQSLQGKGVAETTPEDNLHTLALVFRAYASARQGRAMGENELQPPH